MRNCLFTINIGNFLTTYARDKMVAACDRWGCDFAEIHEILVPNYASCSKYLGPERLAGYRKILMVDADIVISDHAPNPFNICQEDNVLFAVSDYAQEPNHCQKWIDGPYTIGTKWLLEEHPELHPPGLDTFFNGGWWMAVNNPNLRAMFRRAISFLKPEMSELKETFYMEMGITNIVAHNDKRMKICLLPETWNHMIPQDQEPRADYYMNHFGGWAKQLLAQKNQEYEDSKRNRGSVRDGQSEPRELHQVL